MLGQSAACVKLAPGTPKSKRAELVKVLELWLETGFPSHMKTLRLVDLTAPSNAPDLAGLDREHAQRLLVWGDRFFVSWRGILGRDKAVPCRRTPPSSTTRPSWPTASSPPSDANPPRRSQELSKVDAPIDHFEAERLV